jgi:septal ring factor EnvC (AmiA/AmiB activator)
MKLLFYILSLLTIIAAAYFSNENKANFEEQQKFRINTIRLNENVSAQADKTEAQLKDERNKLTDAEKARAEVEQSIASLESKERELRRELGEIEAQLEAQNEKIKQAQEALAELKKVFEEMGFDGDVDMDSIQRNIKTLEDRRKVLTA